jgi:hypothetical protein
MQQIYISKRLKFFTGYPFFLLGMPIVFRYSCLSLYCSFCLATGALAQVQLPDASPRQILVQEVGLGKITINYCRPAARGRRVAGNLVPYQRLWRTGANEATTIHFSMPVKIANKWLDSGSYALYTLPDVATWEIIFNKGTKNWGTEGYNEADDVVRLKADVGKHSKTAHFTIQVTDISPTFCHIQLNWEKIQVQIPVSFNTVDMLRKQIADGMLQNNKPYWQAAQFYFEYDRNLTKALENVNLALVTQPNAYWMWLYKANIQKEMSDFAGALQSSEQSYKLATKAGNEDYQLLNEQFQKKLKNRN